MPQLPQDIFLLKHIQMTDSLEALLQLGTKRPIVVNHKS